MSDGPVFIAIAGGQAAGKKSVQGALTTKLLELHGGPAGAFHIVQLHMLDFLRDEFAVPAPAAAATAAEATAEQNIERVDAYDLERMVDAVESLKRGQSVDVPCVDVVSLRRTGSRVLSPPADVVIAEGCFLLCNKRLVELAAVKIFVDCDPDVRLARRVIRDSESRDLSLDYIFDQHVRLSKAAFESTILPTKPVSDIILPRGTEGPGVELIAQGVMEDIKGGLGASKRPPLAGTLSAGSSHSQLPITLSEADLTTGARSYYETV